MSKDKLRKYTELYELAPIGYFSFNEEGIITEVNQAGCDLLGLQKQAILHRSFSRYIAREHQSLFTLYIHQAFTNALKTYELIVLRWSKPSFYGEFQCKMIENKETQHKILLVFITDISTRKEINASLHLQRTKMAAIDRIRSIGELVTGIAHEQINAITNMNNYLQGCIRRIESNNFKTYDIITVLKKVANQSRLISDSIMTHKTLASKIVIHYSRADINVVVKQTLALLAFETPEYPVTIQFTEYSNPNIVLKLDAIHLQQALLNLTRNSIEAMRDSRTHEPKLCVEISEQSENLIQISIFDNGPGINKDLVNKVFEAHYTTKSYGIGLGLTVSRVIIEKHGGQIFALENPSGGACFGFTLPFMLS